MQEFTCQQECHEHSLPTVAKLLQPWSNMRPSSSHCSKQVCQIVFRQGQGTAASAFDERVGQWPLLRHMFLNAVSTVFSL